MSLVGLKYLRILKWINCELPNLKDWEKWTVSHESWAEPLYPKCCYGPAYVLSPRAVIGIVKAYEKTLVHFSKFEDIYITGNDELLRQARVN